MSWPWRFLPQAGLDLEDIADHFLEVEAGDPRLADRFNAAIEDALRRLGTQPRAGPEFGSTKSALRGLRVWTIRGFPSHLVLYVIRKDRIEVVRVVHGSMDLRRRSGSGPGA
ncbi:MAG: type II toxin-antitoxin system RelE/ParE family toxin [Planctomycetota bacterium]|nr:type II toxin-antitoxin system RelE/ParE family toxin [Planctomycetota bacterium]